MSICKQCYKEVPDNFGVCWNCGHKMDGESIPTKNFPQKKEKDNEFTTVDVYSSESENCPNCGGYKLKRLGNEAEKRNQFVLWSFIFAFFTWGLTLLLIPFAFLHDNKHDRNDVEYKCEICGFSFYYSPGTPWPHAKVNLELITKGNQKLEKDKLESDQHLNWYMNNDKS